MKVKALAYLGIKSQDLGAWEDFARDVLALAPERSENRIKLRLDERTYRIDIRAASQDGIAWFGWEVSSPADLEECRAALQSYGIEVDQGTPEEIEDREVIDLIRFVDPQGMQHEICYGASFASEPVVFTRPGTSYETGELGLGHLAIGVTDMESSVRFFCDVLGFRITDVMPGMFAFLRCNTRHHSAAVMKWDHPTMHHILLQAGNLEQVGKTLDAAEERGLVTKTLGRHAIDDLVSFYVRTPSGWDMEVGFGGIRINEDEWVVRKVGRPFSSWGHRDIS